MEDTDLSSAETPINPVEGEEVGHQEEAHGASAEAKEQEVLPAGIKERLGRQEKRHQKELRHLRAQMEALQSRLHQPAHSPDTPINPYTGSNIEEGSIEDHIHKAVNYALQQKDLQARQEKERAHQALIAEQYHELNNHLDKMADKYEDFQDVVMGNNVPFTGTMRETALLLPKTGAGSAGETLYTLAKNRKELERIAALHPVEQASELVKLSHALISGKESAPTHSSAHSVGNIKATPVTNSHAITDKTSVSEIRKRMKAGWK